MNLVSKGVLILLLSLAKALGNQIELHPSSTIHGDLGGVPFRKCRSSSSRHKGNGELSLLSSHLLQIELLKYMPKGKDKGTNELSFFQKHALKKNSNIF